MEMMTIENVKSVMFSNDGLEFATVHKPYKLYSEHRKEILQWCKERNIKIEWVEIMQADRYIKDRIDILFFHHWRCNSKEDSLKVLLVWG